LSASTIRSTSPQAPTELIAEAPELDGAAVAGLASKARAAQREWGALGAAKRAAALTAVATDLRSRRDEAIELVIREVGKPRGEAAGEVDRGIAILEYYAQAAFAPLGEVFPASLQGLLYTERRPYGLAGLITPWNFPIAIPLWKAVPALVSGNSVLIKPSPEALGNALFLEQLFRAHLPENTFVVATGDAAAGAAVVESADVVSFTGSVAVGRIVAAAAANRGVPVQCEMGGQNAAIVLPDADPVTTAIEIAGAAMGYAGQKCTATRRILVVGDNSAFVGALVDAVVALAPGDPGTGGVSVGPVITDGARARVLGAIEAARADGARVLAGGAVPDRDGWFVTPALVDGVEPSQALMQEETFGPLATVHTVASLDQAIRIANGVRFGLAASIHGRDVDALLTAAATLDAGMIKVNASTTGADFYAPFGGEKASSLGPREQGPTALEFYTSPRTISFAPHGR
jgi:alpha-ketoglutaric semialdehyde dehydrogenase